VSDRVTSRRRSRRGQALVEFALVMPLFFGLLFGLIELSLLFGVKALCHDATDSALRLETIVDMRDSGVDQHAVDRLLAAVHPLFMAHVVRIEIYLTDATGAAPKLTAENIYDGAGLLQTNHWPVSSRISMIDAPLYIGVRVTYRYDWLTSFIAATGATITLQENAIAPEQLLGG